MISIILTDETTLVTTENPSFLELESGDELQINQNTYEVIFKRLVIKTNLKSGEFNSMDWEIVVNLEVEE